MIASFTETDMYTHIFFDLDGTITDPFDGICECVKFSLEHFGIYSKKEDLKVFIGPPLKDSYMKYYNMSEGDALAAVAKYRERYSVKGIFECELYEGVRELLERLSKKYTLVLATSKPQEYAEKILEHFDIKKYFTHVVGASFDDKRSQKNDVLRYAIEKASAIPEKSVMVGDRVFDTEGAVENGMDAVGVLYGYGDRGEHKRAVFVAENVLFLSKFFEV